MTSDCDSVLHEGAETYCTECTGALYPRLMKSEDTLRLICPECNEVRAVADIRYADVSLRE